MEFNGEDSKTRDPFQSELLDAVKKRASRVLDENDNADTSKLNEFNPKLNSKMSKYQSKLIDPEEQKLSLRNDKNIETKQLLESEINFSKSNDFENMNNNTTRGATQEMMSNIETGEKPVDRRVSRHKKESVEQRRNTVRLENELEQLFSSSSPAFAKKDFETDGKLISTEQEPTIKSMQDTISKSDRRSADEHLQNDKDTASSPIGSPRRPKPRPRSTISKNSELDQTYSKETTPRELDFIKSTPQGTSTPSLLDSLMEDEMKQRMQTERQMQELQNGNKLKSNGLKDSHNKSSRWKEEEIETAKKPATLKRQTSMKTPRSSTNDSPRTLERKHSQRRDKEQGKSAEKQRTTKQSSLKRSSSLTNISNLQPKSLDELKSSGSARQNALTIREKVYYEWLHNKTLKTKELTKDQSQKAKMEEKEKEEEKIQRKIMAEKTFDAWSQTKGVKLKEKKKSVKEIRLQEKEEEDEKLQKKLDGKKFYESWKQRKDEVVKEQFKKKQRAARRRKEEEEREQKEKKMTAQKVFDNWKSKKEEQLQNSIEAKAKKQKEERLAKMAEYEKKKEAEKAFESWKSQKVISPRQQISPSLTQRSWRPNGTLTRNAIPEKIQPVVIRPNHKRTLSASGRLHSSKPNQIR